MTDRKAFAKYYFIYIIHFILLDDNLRLFLAALPLGQHYL